MDIPITHFEDYLRCIRLADLDELSRDTLDFVCQQFFGRDIVNEAGNIANEALRRELPLLSNLADCGQEAPFAYRRFAGDSSLPRSRYYTIANNEHGNDGGTLEAELGVYSDLEKAGPVSIHDTLSMDAGLWTYFWQFKRTEFSHLAEFFRAINGSIIFHFDYRKTQVSFDFADSYETCKIYSQAARFNYNEFAVFVPTTVSRHSIERCIDLRRPETLQAMMKFLDDGVPKTFTCDKRGAYKPLNVSGSMFAEPSTSVFTDSDDPEALFYSASPFWDGKDLNLPPGLPRLLSYLTYGQRGGSPLTDAIARQLRLAQVDALIFPSARCDVQVDIRCGDMQAWSGWNLVDYRDAPPPHAKASIIIEPQSWMNPLPGYELSIPPIHHEFAGSFTLKGPTEALHSYLEAAASRNRGV